MKKIVLVVFCEDGLLLGGCKKDSRFLEINGKQVSIAEASSSFYFVVTKGIDLIKTHYTTGRSFTYATTNHNPLRAFNGESKFFEINTPTGGISMHIFTSGYI